MKVIKRNGKSTDFNPSKITKRIKDQSKGLNIDSDKISISVISQMADGITTRELDTLCAELASTNVSYHHDYSKLASRIFVTALRKETPDTFSDAVDILSNRTTMLAPEYIEFVRSNSDELDNMIVQDRDFNHDIFGLKTLERSYLMRDEQQNIVERPQYMWLRVATEVSGYDIRKIRETYDAMSLKRYTHATPTLFNSCTKLSQLSSCFLIANKGDDIDGLFDTMKDVAKISKLSGGIGLHIHNVRAAGSIIKGTNGKSDGILPLCKTYNEVARWINQCFHEDSIIYTNNGLKKIKDLKAKDLVLTKDGVYSEIKGVLEYEQKDKMIEIDIRHSIDTLKVTDAHPIYSIENHRRDTISPNPKWVDSGKLLVGDFVGQVVPREVIDVKNFSEDDSFLYGLFLGDGHITKDGYECGVSLNPNSLKDGEFKEFIYKYLKDRKIHYWENKKTNYLQIRWSAKHLPFDKSDLYDSNGDKSISVKYSHLPRKKSIKIIKGLILSNGGVYRGNEIHFYNSSKILIEGLRYQILRFKSTSNGDLVFKKEHKALNADGELLKFPDSYSYDLRIPSFSELAKELKIKESKSKHYFYKDGCIWTRIKSINEYVPDSKVYDLKVEDHGDPSYMLSQCLVHNGGKRKGSFAMYLEPWHADIFEFLDLKKNTGKEEMRARDLFYAIWNNDLFMQRVKEDGEWHLFCPNEVLKATGGRLQEVYGAEFNELYKKCVDLGVFKKKIRARELWEKILTSQIETGTPYMAYKDRANLSTNQKNLGVIQSSNLCIEIYEYSDKDEQAVCNLASLGLPAFVVLGKDGKLYFDFNLLGDTVRLATRNLDNVIDANYYPTVETERSNSQHRPIGLGVQGLADVFAMLKLPFDSPEAKQLNKDIFEHIYYYSLEESNKLAIERGAYPTFNGSPASKGILQFDMYEETPDLNPNLEWEALKAAIINRGLRNSLLIALMPTASTSQILGYNEAFEPFTSNMYTRGTLSGTFVVVNQYLIKDLEELGLWDLQMRKDLMVNNGSVMNIPRVPADIKEIYKTVYELSMKTIIDLSADRQRFVCQGQSMNLFVDNATMSKLSSMHMYAWEKKLKTGMYYLRTKPAVDAIKFTVTKDEVKKVEEEISTDDFKAMIERAKNADPDDCEMCGS